MNAVYFREWQSARFFLEQGVDPDYKSADGSSARTLFRERQGEERDTTGAAFMTVRSALEHAR
jgi:hypothetical protein